MPSLEIDSDYDRLEEGEGSQSQDSESANGCCCIQFLLEGSATMMSFLAATLPQALNANSECDDTCVLKMVLLLCYGIFTGVRACLKVAAACSVENATQSCNSPFATNSLAALSVAVILLGGTKSDSTSVWMSVAAGSLGVAATIVQLAKDYTCSAQIPPRRTPAC